MPLLEIKPTSGMRYRVFAVIACALLIAVYFMYLLAGGGGGLLAEKSMLVTYMPNAAGLSSESPVQLNGIVVGRVTHVQLSPAMDKLKAVRVELQVESRYLKGIPADSITSVSADNLLGDKLVKITVGKSPVSVLAWGELPTEPLAEAVDKADLIRTMERNLNQVDVILTGLADKNSKFGAMLLTDDYYRTLLSRVADFQQGLHAVLTPQSDLGKAFFSMEMYNGIRGQVMKLDSQLTAIQQGEGDMGRLFASDEQYNSMVASLRDLRTTLADVNSGKGELARVLKSDEDYRKAKQLLQLTDETLAALIAGRGSAGELLVNPQLYESLDGSLRTMQMLLKDVQSNPKKYLRAKVF